MESITYQEAANLLGVSINRIYGAVSSGILTQAPSTGRLKKLYLEQVKLFQGKPITFSVLTEEQYRTWESIAQKAAGQGIPTHHNVLAESAKQKGRTWADNFIRGSLERLKEANKNILEYADRPLVH